MLGARDGVVWYEEKKSLHWGEIYGRGGFGCRYMMLSEMVKGWDERTPNPQP